MRAPVTNLSMLTLFLSVLDELHTWEDVLPYAPLELPDMLLCRARNVTAYPISNYFVFMMYTETFV